MKRRRSLLLLAIAAGLAWATVAGMLMSGELDRLGPLAALRLIFILLLLLAAALTFVPLARLLGYGLLAFEGIAGSSLLLYTLAFVPPPTGWLLALPDLPVYALLALALFWTTSALAFAPLYGLGQRLFANRARQFDRARAHRQAHELGGLLAGAVALAGLRVLTPISLILLVLIALVSELLFLSRVETPA